MRPLIVKALQHAVRAPRSGEKLALTLLKWVQTTVALDDCWNVADNPVNRVVPSATSP